MFQAPSPYPGQHNLDDSTVFNMTHVTPSNTNWLPNTNRLPGLTKKEHELYTMLQMKSMTAQLQQPTQPTQPEHPQLTSNSQDMERQLQLLEILARLVGIGKWVSTPSLSQPSLSQPSLTQASLAQPSIAQPPAAPLLLISLLVLVFVMLIVVIVLLVLTLRSRKSDRVMKIGRRPTKKRKPTDQEWLATLTSSVRAGN